MNDQTESRKGEHLKISLNQDVQARKATTGFENIHLIHKALPEVDKRKIDLSTFLFDKKLSAPFIVGAITGGTPEATEINSVIAEAVEELGLGMGVGSQRVAIEEKSLEGTFAIAREKAPTAFLIANIGGAQLINGYGLNEVKIAINMIDADAVAIHLNPLQEAIQPEGQTNFQGLLKKIQELTLTLDCPVIVKETGAGIGGNEAQNLERAGVAGIDVSGLGGTSWSAVEYYRAKKHRREIQQRLGNVFWDWGIPTAISVLEVSQSVNVPLIASGGIRDGMDMAKALALGSSLTSLSLPVLKAAIKGLEETKRLLSLLTEELKTVMFLTGTDSIQKLHHTPLVVTGKTAEWARARGLNLQKYAQRRGI